MADDEDDDELYGMLMDDDDDDNPSSGPQEDAPDIDDTKVDQGDGDGTTYTKKDVEDYIRQAAIARGIDPETAVAVAKSEALNVFDPMAKKDAGGDNGTSFGPFQLHVGGGLGDVFQKKTGMDPSDPSTWKAQVNFALDQAALGGWGPWHGAKNSGIGEWDGLDGAKPLGASSYASDGSGGVGPLGYAVFGDTGTPPVGTPGSPTNAASAIIAALANPNGSPDASMPGPQAGAIPQAGTGYRALGIAPPTGLGPVQGPPDPTGGATLAPPAFGPGSPPPGALAFAGLPAMTGAPLPVSQTDPNAPQPGPQTADNSDLPPAPPLPKDDSSGSGQSATDMWNGIKNLPANLFGMGASGLGNLFGIGSANAQGLDAHRLGRALVQMGIAAQMANNPNAAAALANMANAGQTTDIKNALAASKLALQQQQMNAMHIKGFSANGQFAWGEKNGVPFIVPTKTLIQNGVISNPASPSAPAQGSPDKSSPSPGDDVGNAFAKPTRAQMEANGTALMRAADVKATNSFMQTADQAATFANKALELQQMIKDGKLNPSLIAKAEAYVQLHMNDSDPQTLALKDLVSLIHQSGAYIAQREKGSGKYLIENGEAQLAPLGASNDMLGTYGILGRIGQIMKDYMQPNVASIKTMMSQYPKANITHEGSNLTHSDYYTNLYNSINKRTNELNNDEVINDIRARRDAVSNTPNPNAGPIAKSGSQPSASDKSSIPMPTTQPEYDALPKGSQFRKPDGTIWVK